MPVGNRVKDKVVLRIGFMDDSLPLAVTNQESATKPIFKATLVKWGSLSGFESRIRDVCSKICKIYH